MKSKKSKYNKFLAVWLLIAVLTITGCTPNQTSENNLKDDNYSEVPTSSAAETPSQKAKDDSLAKFLERAETFKSPTREYGESEKIIVNQGDLLASVDYPKGDIKRLNQISQDWAENVLSIYDDESIKGGELIVSYNSYLIDDTYASVEFYGEFISDGSLAPTQLAATFSADRKTGEILKLSDIATEDEMSAIVALVLKQTGLKSSEIDDEILNKWLMLEDGIQITLMAGKYLPTEDGEKKILIPKKIIAKLNEQVDDVLTQSETSTAIESTQETQSQPVGEDETQSQTQAETEASVQTTTEALTETSTEVAAAPAIALTFDDGPSGDTWRLIDLLNSYDIKATFFILGVQIDQHQDVLKHMVDSGHELATHSWDHRDFTKQSNSQITDEIMQTRAKLYEVTGVDSVIVRPPYGAVNDRVRSVAKETGVFFVNWNVDPLDWKTRNADAIVNAILNDVKDGAIVLSHDIHPETVDAYEIAIPILVERGYTFKTVTDLIRSGGREPSAGDVFYNR